LKEIGEICRKNGVFFHTDAAQAVGKIPVSVNDMNIDLMSISGHKIYGPKGIGGVCGVVWCVKQLELLIMSTWLALYVRRKPRVRVEALQSGGGQERGIRSGTLPTPLIVGLGAACRVAKSEMAADTQWVNHLWERLYRKLSDVWQQICARASHAAMTYTTALCDVHRVCNISNSMVMPKAAIMEISMCRLPTSKVKGI
jgi:cysteine desulfurase